MPETASLASVPSSRELMRPVFEAIQALGGSASNGEIHDWVIQHLALSDDIVQIPHDRGSKTRLEYNLAWARTHLKRYDLIENSHRGVWSLTANGRNTTFDLEADTVAPKPEGSVRMVQGEVEDETVAQETWRETLLSILLNMAPDAFERLCARLLRESGFTDVDVTGKTGDGGIDGKGHIQFGGLISFPVLFQCKRYQGSVGADIVRNFRGAMLGRADRGLIVTTGYFTVGARAEATRDGAPPIDLIDGEQLMDNLRQLQLGVRIKTVEVVEINNDWFDKI